MMCTLRFTQIASTEKLTICYLTVVRSSAELIEVWIFGAYPLISKAKASRVIFIGVVTFVHCSFKGWGFAHVL